MENCVVVLEAMKKLINSSTHQLINSSTHHLIIFSFFAFLIFSNASCEKECTINYLFEFPSTITPTAPNYSIGDTIWINIEYEENNLFEKNENKNLMVGDFNFLLEFGIGKLNDPFSVNGTNDFDYKVISGELNRLDIGRLTSYRLKQESIAALKITHFCIIPNTIGEYYLNFLSPISLSKDIDFLNEDCMEFIDVSFKTNNDSNNNYELYIENNQPPFSEITFEEYSKAGLYTFKVVE